MLGDACLLCAWPVTFAAADVWHGDVFDFFCCLDADVLRVLRIVPVFFPAAALLLFLPLLSDMLTAITIALRKCFANLILFQCVFTNP